MTFKTKELSLRPYNGRLFIAYSKKAYEKAHVRLFDEPDVLNCTLAGRFSGGKGKDGMWTYLVWGAEPHAVAHELTHAVLHVFEQIGVDPRDSGGEPFCYLLGQLILDASTH